jgi:hypothetical protein
MMKAGVLPWLLAVSWGGAASVSAQEAPKTVSVADFPRAETDRTLAVYGAQGGFARFLHKQDPASIADKTVVRMNRDTLYSFGIFDLDAGPVTLTLPDAGKRYMMAQVLDEDQFTHDIVYAPQAKTYTRAQIGTRYLVVIIRTLVDPESEADLKTVHALQNAVSVRQAGPGSLELPAWDTASLDKIRGALKTLGTMQGVTTRMFGAKNEVDPVSFLIGSATGWGGNPSSAAIYLSRKPKDSSGKQVESLRVRDVPVDGFWSITVYNAAGFFEENALNAYSINNLTARPSADGSVRVQFGGCGKTTANCLPIMKGWNYTVRLYRPRASLLTGAWRFPETDIVK